jgi:hypothetical protein
VYIWGNTVMLKTSASRFGRIYMFSVPLNNSPCMYVCIYVWMIDVLFPSALNGWPGSYSVLKNLSIIKQCPLDVNSKSKKTGALQPGPKTRIFLRKFLQRFVGFIWFWIETTCILLRLMFSRRWLWRIPSYGMWRRVVWWKLTDG